MADDVRLIDANAAKEKLGFAIGPLVGSDADIIRNDALLDAIKIIDSMPTVDAHPLKRGHWSECWRDPVRNVISVICSECENASITCLPIIILDGDDVLKKICIQMPYCPKCGADMREVLEYETDRP